MLESDDAIELTSTFLWPGQICKIAVMPIYGARVHTGDWTILFKFLSQVLMHHQVVRIICLYFQDIFLFVIDQFVLLDNYGSTI